jgi:phosphonatase-like hydrolase
MIIKAVLFDLIGTTVKEKDPEYINNCFINAFNENGIKVLTENIRVHRGRDKMDIIQNVLKDLNYPPDSSEYILASYKKLLEMGFDNFSEIDGFREIMDYLKNENIKSGLGTGLSRDFLDKVITFLGWENAGFDYIAASEDVGKGRPDPAMAFDMMKNLNLEPVEILKVGDTFSDILEGKNAGVKTAAILSGTQSESVLRKYNPDFIINNLTELKEIIK